MKRRWPFFLAMPLIGGSILTWRLTRPVEVLAARVVRGTAVEAVYATGTVEAVDRVEVKARIAGPVDLLVVREGDDVRAGQLLARIDAPTLAIDVSRGKVDLGAARIRASQAPQIAALEAEARAMEAQLAQARSDVERQDRLTRSGSGRASELDQARMHVSVLEAQIAANRAQQRDVRIGLRTDAARTQASLEALEARATDADVRAPMDGVVLARHVEPGEVVGVNQNVLRIGNLSRLWIEAQVDEADIGRIRLGMEAAVRLYAFEDRVVPARVTRILPDADRERKSFEVDLELSQAVEGLRPGMTAEVNVVTRRHPDVVLAPSDGVRDGFAWVVSGGHARRRAVSVGIRDLARVEVLRGVRAGDTVVLGDDKALSEGARVRATLQEVHRPTQGAKQLSLR